ncbi:MAG TPA: outer membrane beta-barrel protein [Tepidisphaeraceae bacterium]|jgi:opacity protein-like surface antigen|nr:outer membrane beta-barrel protein [Tepidisphaeraceae bacterium]
MLRKAAVCSVVAAMAMAMTGNSASASEMRQGIEVFGIGRFMTGDDTRFDAESPFDGEAGFDVDPSFMLGAGFGINFNAFINLNFTLAGGPCDFEYINLGEIVIEDGTIVTGDVNLDLYLIDGPVTPFITGGIGFVSTNGERRGDGEGEDVGETNPAGNFGGGVRFDFGDHLFMKLLYRATLTTLEDAADNLLFHSGGVAVGWRF